MLTSKFSTLSFSAEVKYYDRHKDKPSKTPKDARRCFLRAHKVLLRAEKVLLEAELPNTQHFGIIRTGYAFSEDHGLQHHYQDKFDIAVFDNKGKEISDEITIYSMTKDSYADPSIKEDFGRFDPFDIAKSMASIVQALKRSIKDIKDNDPVKQLRQRAAKLGYKLVKIATGKSEKRS